MTRYTQYTRTTMCVFVGVVMLALSACPDTSNGDSKDNSNPVDSVQITVTFNTVGGSAPPRPVTVNSGDTIAPPTNPTHTCYASFEGWTTRADYRGENFDFSASVHARDDFTLYAKWDLAPVDDEHQKKQICHWKQLEWVAAVGASADTKTARYGHDYVLTADLVFPAPGTDSFSLYGFVPIGHDTGSQSYSFDGHAFAGTFDGNNKTIKSLFIDTHNANWPDAVDTEYVGLFGNINAADDDATVVKNLTIQLNNESPSIDTEKGYVGALAGQLTKGAIDSVSVEQGYIKGDNRVGGLVGLNSGTIRKSSSNSTVQGNSDVGGLVGHNTAYIKGHFSGTARGHNTSLINGVGGMVGHNDNNGTVIGYATGAVRGGWETPDYSYNVGGLVGYNKGTVIGYATNEVSGFRQVGGLVGLNQAKTIGYATGRIIRIILLSEDIGGIVGKNKNGDIVGYTTTTFNILSPPEDIKESIGGAVGNNVINSQEILEVYWNIAAVDSVPAVGDGSVDGIIGVSDTKNIVFANSVHKDSQDTADTDDDITIFDAQNFANVFDSAHGADKTWPKLKTAFTIYDNDYTFDMFQPTHDIPHDIP